MRCRKIHVGFIGLPFVVGIVTYCLGDVSGVKDGREVLEIVFLKCRGRGIPGDG